MALNSVIMRSAPIILDKQVTNNGGAIVTPARTVNGNHIRYTFNDVNSRVRQDRLTPKTKANKDDTDNLNVYTLTLIPDGTSDTFWLPYGWNEIVRLSDPRLPSYARCAIGVPARSSATTRR
jgi:hypothetical protein